VKMTISPSRGQMPRELSVGEVAARSGVAVSTIHFYESKGLIKSWRNNGARSWSKIARSRLIYEARVHFQPHLSIPQRFTAGCY
jgi:MerR family regulatory protein